MGSEYGGAVLLASDVVPDDSSYILGYNSNLNYNDNSFFMENQPVGTIVGEFNATDPDGDELSYHLVSGAGDDNNSLFTIDANGTLKTAAVLDYEAGSNLSIRVQARDEYNASVEGNFTVALSDVNDPATGTVSISGMAEVGQTLSVSNNLVDADGLNVINYQWYRNGIPINSTIKDGHGGVDGLKGVSTITVSPDGYHAYVAATSDNAVSWFDRNASTGALTYGGVLKDGENGVDGLNGAWSVTLSSDGSHAYVTGYGEDAVSWFERNASTGALSYRGMLKDGVNGVDGLQELIVLFFHLMKHAYVTGSIDDAVSWYAVDKITGALTYGGMFKEGINISGVLHGANGLFVSSDGNHVYVTSLWDKAISWYERNTSTGSLIYIGMLKEGEGGVDGLTNVRSITLSPDGYHAYVAASFDNTVSWYARNASTGALTYGGVLRDGENGVDGFGAWA